MRKYWWKYLGAGIIVYVIIAGLLIPLKPGIESISPSSGKAGETVTFTVEGYNSNFDKSNENIRAWLRTDAEISLAASDYKVVDYKTLELTYNIPQNLPFESKVKYFSLIIDNEFDGASVLPSAVSITQDSINVAEAGPLWQKNGIQNLNIKEGISFPYRNILYETIRNTYFHVSLWLAMMILFIASVVMSIRYLRTFNKDFDDRAVALTTVGLMYGILGLITGSIWAKHTWGTYWTWQEIKLNMTAVALLIYAAYFILRSSMEDNERKSRISAVYNIFAFAALIPLIYVVPRLTSSLHPGNGGNPAFGSEDLDNTMRMVFYPAVIGFTLLGVWISTLIYRLEKIKDHYLENV